MTGYESKKHMAQDKLNKAIEPHTITFHNINSDWVMRITADRRIEVNEGVEVTEAAQKVLDALQNLLKPAQPEQEPKHYLHTWGKDGERCVVCGDKDWMGTSCKKISAPQPEQEPVALVIDGVLVKSALPEKYTGHLYTTPPQRTEQNFCERCGKRTKDIHTCTPPPQENT